MSKTFADQALTIQVRTAGYADAEPVIQLDQVAQAQRSRVNFIHQAISSRRAYVAIVDQQVVGYCVLQYNFFDRGFISLAYVQDVFRRRGVGTALLKHLESVCRTQKLFTSTNESNQAMRSLLTKLQYEPSGEIKNLGDDPECVYCKRLTANAARPEVVHG